MANLRKTFASRERADAFVASIYAVPRVSDIEISVDTDAFGQIQYVVCWWYENEQE